jgi:hypothetical protein
MIYVPHKLWPNCKQKSHSLAMIVTVKIPPIIVRTQNNVVDTTYCFETIELQL